MGNKTLSIDEKAYNALNCLKKPDESFSDLILRLTQEKKKGIKAVLEWLETLNEEKSRDLAELANSIEQVNLESKKAKWRNVIV